VIEQNGMEGAGYLSPGYLSPDGSRVICVFNPESEAVQALHPWIVDLRSWEAKKLTDEDSKPGQWDGSVSWRSDSQEILFVRLERVGDVITTALMRVSASGGVPGSIVWTRCGRDGGLLLS